MGKQTSPEIQSSVVGGVVARLHLLVINHEGRGLCGFVHVHVIKTRESNHTVGKSLGKYMYILPSLLQSSESSHSCHGNSSPTPSPPNTH